MKSFFGALSLLGIFLFGAGFAGSHGHFQFRPHMTGDWVMFGTPIIGIIGFLLAWQREVNRKNEWLKTHDKNSIEFHRLSIALVKAISVLKKTEKAEEFAFKLEITKARMEQVELSELENLWIWFGPTGVWDEFVGESGIELGTEIFELIEKLRSQVN